MKNVITSALAVAVVTTNVPVQAFAENVILDDTVETVNQKINSKVGNLEVDINFGLPIKNSSISNTNMKVELKKDDKVIAEIPLGSDSSRNTFEYEGNVYNYTINRLNFDKSTEVKEGEKTYNYRICFENLQAEQDMFYGLNISGNGFKTATVDKIELNYYSKRVIVSNMKSSDQNGAILFGDVNKDGIVNQEDYDKVHSNLKTNNLEYDLNRDGKVNIVDLTYVHKNMGKEQGSADVQNTNAIIDVQAVEVKIPEDAVEGIQMHGNVADLFSDEGNISIQMPNGVGITEKTPAKLDINLATGERSHVLMEQIVIKGGTNAPKAAPLL